MRTKRTLILVSLLIWACNRNHSIGFNEIQNLRKNCQGGAESLVAEVMPKLLGKEWKSADWKKVDGKLRLSAVYGGNSPMSFSTPDSYQAYTKEVHIWNFQRLGYLVSECNLESIQLSLSKPFFIKGEENQDSSVQEFEVLRSRITGEKLTEFWQRLPQGNPYQTPDREDPRWKESQKLWESLSTWELDELRRVELE